MIAAVVLVAGIFGGPELASRVYETLDQSLPGSSEPAGRTTAPTSTTGGTVRGPVARVTDGDTLTIGTQRIRICGINTPERGETNYREAGDALRRIVEGQTLECRQVGNGTPCDGKSSPSSYDRIVAQCFAGSLDVAAEMVATGLAEDWERYSGGYYAR